MTGLTPYTYFELQSKIWNLENRINQLMIRVEVLEKEKLNTEADAGRVQI